MPLRALSCLALASWGISPSSAAEAQRLAVVVPAHAGDLQRAVSALDRWPTTCSPITQENVDLVLYYAEGDDDPEPSRALDTISSTAGRCFANTKLVFANLDAEEDAYPKGPSVQFYKMFLDDGVKADLSAYDALAIVEWDVLVASDRSFAELYRAAFENSEDFWVKGSNLEGTNFHSVAESSEMWHVMGHINGNAIYNNNDPVFTEFVEYTRARWEYKYPYDVALWATIADFPYSWPLWQRFSSKFVTTNLISNVGYEHVDSKTVSDAVAGETLFIHGSSVDTGNLAVLKAATSTSEANDDLLCKTACDDAAGAAGTTSSLLPPGTSTICDPTCTMSDSRFGGHLCGVGDSDKYGPFCRLCYTDVEEARKADKELGDGLHVIMCDTRRPPSAPECSEECGAKKDTVCDDTCGTGLHGDYNCNWRGLGEKCRFCFRDTETALAADEVAKLHGGRVVMCDTHEPPVTPDSSDERAPVTTARRLTDTPKWEDNQKWKDNKKWQGVDGGEPKWKQAQKWKRNTCLDGCERTSSNGTKGRVCDASCETGEPYGRLGCSAKQGQFGRFCRTCYNDVDLAMAADTADDRAIMCDTLEPVSAYDHRQLSAVARELTTDDTPKWEDNQKWKDNKKWQGVDGGEPKWKQAQKWKRNTCLDGCERTSSNGTKGRVCDASCETGEPYGRLGCSAKQGQFGRFCRTCYNDVDLAMAADTPEDRAIMCDTLEPVSAYDHRQLSAVARELTTDDTPKWEDNQKWKDNKKWQGVDGGEPKWKQAQKWKRNTCLDGCERTSSNGTKGRVCDSSCETGEPYGRLGCSAKQGQFGRFCRTCYNDVDLAMAADTADDRAIMCDTLEPVSAYTHRQLSAVARELTTDDTPKWEDNQKWKDNKKWQGVDGGEPKWKQAQKWKRNTCLDGCVRTSSNGTKGRVCDASCETGEPYGRLGCSAKQGQYGRFCRTCYNDVDIATAADTADDRAIMCDTLEPVSAYNHRQLSAVARELTTDDTPKWEDNQKWKDNKKWQGVDGGEPKWKQAQKWKRNTCLDGCERTSSNGTKGRVCDASCETGEPYGRLGCSAKQGQFGRFCRTCYNDVDLAMAADTADDRAIMCDTLEPVSAYNHRQLSAISRELTTDETPKWEDNQKWKDNKKWQGVDGGEPKWKQAQKWKRNTCLDGCERTSSNGTKGRVCDSSCETGEPYGRLGCSAKQGQFGRFCRTCYNDVDLAMAADTADDRAIMCDTLEPVSAYNHRQLSAVSRELTTDETPKWEDNQKWKDNKKWQGVDGGEPKWKQAQKWKRNKCLDGCERTSSNGTKGRVCDSSCETGEPYGRLGCSAKQGQFGRFCRTCYNDVDLAMAADTPEDRAIMCDTVEPVTAYDSRRLSRDTEVEEYKEGEFEWYMQSAADTDFTHDVKRGEICAFIEGGVDRLQQTEVTVQSILEFVPGMRVAVATEPGTLAAYESAVGFYTGVRVSSTPNAGLAALFADQHCGEGTKLVLYMRPGSVLSRSFTSKDTHTPRGELVVVYGDARQSFRDAQIARETAAVLGFDAPSFTHGTDLLLPIGANADLRAELHISGDEAADRSSDSMEELTSVPQLLAALAYSRNTDGVHFVNPQAWVTQNLFKQTSIWDIPLMKPRYACALPEPPILPKSLLDDDAARADVLERSLGFFRMGGSCENGIVTVDLP